METSGVLSRIKAIQTTLNVFSLLNFNHQFFPLDANVTDNSCFDYVVVGAGIGGCVISARLVEAGYRVLVLEAGGIANLETHFPGLVTYIKRTNVDWNYTAEATEYTDKCHKDRVIMLPRVLGGAGATNYMLYARGNPSDYSKWSKTVKDNSWMWENMMKYFKKCENLLDNDIINSPFGQYHGINGKINITREPSDVCNDYIEGFRSGGQLTPIDNIGNGNVGYCRGLYQIFNGVRNSAAYSYIMPLKKKPKLYISYHSLVTKIIFDEHNNALGVKFIKNGKKITVKAAKEVILCSGPIKSPQLLMLSGIGPSKHLKEFKIPCRCNLPVGENLQSLVGTYLVFKTNRTAKLEAFNAHKFISPLVTGYAAINKTNEFPDYESLNFIIDDYYYFLSFCGFTLDFTNEICDLMYRKAQNTQLLSTILSNLNVTSSGKVLLKNTDSEAPPKIITGYYSKDEDLDSEVMAIEHYMKVVSSPYFQKMGLVFIDPLPICGDFKKGSKQYWKCYARCMGLVVDTKLRVKGVNRLRVVDASVIPNTISGTTIGAIAALAEKASEFIISVA